MTAVTPSESLGAVSPADNTPQPLRVRALTRVLGKRRFSQLRALVRMSNRTEWKMRDIPSAQKLRAWSNGFTAENAAIYELDDVNVEQYLPDYARKSRCGKINPLPHVFDQKLLFRRVMMERGIEQPEVIALVTPYGAVLNPLARDSRSISRAGLHDWLLQDGGRFIIKPQDGSYGKGISLLEVLDGQLTIRRGVKSSSFDVSRHLSANTLIERAVTQHAFWNALSPASVNTMRILTLWTPGDSEPFIARAVQRIGTQETLPTDNWDGGGVLANIDLSSGCMKAGRINRFKTTRPDIEYAQHPDTGAQIEGARLPNWKEICASTLQAHRAVPWALYVGWDVGTDEQGSAVFIEGNNNPGLRSLQVGNGLLSDPEIRRFFTSVGVISA